MKDRSQSSSIFFPKFTDRFIKENNRLLLPSYENTNFDFLNNDRFFADSFVTKEQWRKANERKKLYSYTPILSWREKNKEGGGKVRYCYKLLLLNAALRARKKRARVVLIKPLWDESLGCPGQRLLPRSSQEMRKKHKPAPTMIVSSIPIRIAGVNFVALVAPPPLPLLLFLLLLLPPYLRYSR